MPNKMKIATFSSEETKMHQFESREGKIGGNSNRVHGQPGRHSLQFQMEGRSTILNHRRLHKDTQESREGRGTKKQEGHMYFTEKEIHETAREVTLVQVP